MAKHKIQAGFAPKKSSGKVSMMLFPKLANRKDPFQKKGKVTKSIFGK